MRPKLTESYVEKTANLDLNMVFVKGGTFNMGSDDNESRSNERPIHRVSVSDFFISQYPVTQAQWKTVMGTNPSFFKKRRDTLENPVESISWEDCFNFLDKLNELTGKKYRLPTEAEWEYAARGGESHSRNKYSGSKYVKDVAWFGEEEGSTHPVGLKQPNELKIYDMSGNVWEWCLDFFSAYEADLQTNPRGPKYGIRHVCRGGSWEDISDSCRVSTRYSYPTSYHSKTLGLRLAHDIF